MFQVNKIVWYSILLIALGFPILGAGPTATTGILSPQAEVSLVTQWPGHEIYLSWGHSAFRVRDPQNNIDEIFNYGTFNLDDPWFIPRFVRGELNYSLSAYNFQPYLEWDIRTEDRQWLEQVLNLDAAERENLFQFLVWNAKPENAEYRYDFIRDNCSTRIRDALEKILGKRLVYPKDVQGSDWESYREGIDRGVTRERGFAFMFNLVVGSASDRPAGMRESTWQPLVLKGLLDRCVVQRGDQTQPLVSQTRVIYRPQTADQTVGGDFDPNWVLWPLSILALAAAIFRILSRLRGKPRPSRLVYRLADGLLFLFVGLLASLLWYLNFWSDHSAVKANFNLVWLLPSHLVVAWFVFKRRRPLWVGWYCAVAALACVIPWLLLPFWPQTLQTALIPTMLLLLARSAAQTEEIWPRLLKSDRKPR